MVSREFMSSLGQLALRVGAAGILMSHGALKIMATAGGTTWFDSRTASLPPAVQALVAWAEFIAGVLLLLGLLTRLASLAVIVVQAGAIYLVTGEKGLIDTFSTPAGAAPNSMNVGVGWDFNLAVITIAVGLLFLGAGKVSVDWLLWRRKPAAETRPYGTAASAALPAAPSPAR